ncbi:Uncharacterised protein [BD1-7 clade bacterium]|uniref:DUF4325 domain-containing protein n=1 Tax=BD1-7 clade bacterium TaxID=2029982 RepID=A0A5S9Q3S8_9GAMM|nr:Uncharacterised protein [BD1-7 clade bacterium]CAA0111783.1 Uncharacterised protein [BD1-7 clade bacterium]
MNIVLNVANEFHKRPAGRVVSDGPYNGERFRDEFLRPKLNQAIEIGCKLVVDFTGATMAGSSFLEESFGGLVRAGFDKRVLKSFLIIKSDRKVIVDSIESYINTA